MQKTTEFNLDIAAVGQPLCNSELQRFKVCMVNFYGIFSMLTYGILF